MRAESPYRRLATKRTASDLLDAVCALLCLAAVAVGALVALAGCDAAVHGGGDGAIAVALAGLALLAGGTGCSVLLAGVRRG